MKKNAAIAAVAAAGALAALAGYGGYQAGLRHGDARGGLRFSEESHAIQAAIAGHGVALLSRTLVQDELTRGVLVAPFGPELDGPCWRLVRRRDSVGAATQSVWDWLVDAFAIPSTTRG